jgi:hypothetical protein
MLGSKKKSFYARRIKGTDGPTQSVMGQNFEIFFGSLILD